MALNQSAELIDQGHEVTVASTTRGYRVVPTVLGRGPGQVVPRSNLGPRNTFRRHGIAGY